MNGKDYTTLEEMAAACGISKSAISQNKAIKAADFKLVGVRGGKEKRFPLAELPEKYRDAVSVYRAAPKDLPAVPSKIAKAQPDMPPLSPPGKKMHVVTQRELDSLWNVYANKKNNKQKARAKRYVEAVHMRNRLYEEADALRAAGKPFNSRAKIISLVADHFNASIGAVKNWCRAVRDYHPSDWLAVLVPKDGGGPPLAEIPQQAWDYFKADYLRLEAPALAACYERLTRIASDRGWTVPSEKTFERRVKATLSKSMLVLARQGNEAAQRLYPHQERDRSVFHALEAVNADGHKFDNFVRWPDGEIGRPLMCAWQDIYSGKILAYRVDKTENSDAIRLSFGDMVEAYGIPSEAFLDNGRGFASKWMTGGTPTRYRFKVKEEEPSGIMTTLGVKIHWCTPYHGQSKPIERAFRDLCEYVAKHPAFAGAYTGNNPTAKPENYGSKAIDIDVFMKVLEVEIAAHNARTGRTGGLTNGRSFDLVFAESYKTSIIKKATEEQRRLWLLAAESVSVRKVDGTIHMQFDKRNRYWSEELEEHAGQKVTVRFDPQHLHDPVHVYTLDNRFICTAQCLEAEGFADTEAAREHGKNRKRFMKAAKAQLLAERRMTALEVAAMLPDAPDGDVLSSKVVRMIRPERDIPAPTPNTVSDEDVMAAAAGVHQIMEDEASPLAMFGRDPARDYEFWERLDARVSDGETLDGREMEIWEIYPRSEEYRVIKETKALFAAENGS